MLNSVRYEPVTGKINRNLIACGKESTAAVGCYAANISNLGRYKSNYPAIRCFDSALIDDGTGVTSVVEIVFSGKEIAVKHVKR